MKAYGKWLMLTAIVLGLTACGPKDDKKVSSSTQLSILAGSELKDMEPLLSKFASEQGVDLKMQYSGSIEVIDKLNAGSNADAVWVADDRYLKLNENLKSKITADGRVMSSKVVLGINEASQKRLSWGPRVSVKELVKASESGKFTFAMTNPTSSNTGFVPLMTLAATFSKDGNEIPNQALSGFFKGHKLTESSTGALMEKFVANKQGIDGIFTYEAEIEKLAEKGVKLNVIEPIEGVITVNYPLMLISKESASRAIFDKLLVFLKTPESQAWITANTKRVGLKSVNDEIITELPFPAKLATIETLLDQYLNVYSKPITWFMVMDISGSMDQEKRMIHVKEGLSALINGDGTKTGQLVKVRSKERFELNAFDDRAYVADFSGSFDFQADYVRNTQAMKKVIDQLLPQGGTAIFSALAYNIKRAQKEADENPERFVSMLLLTDGENSAGMSFEDFARIYKEQTINSKRPVPVYPILFGGAKKEQMQQIAQLTGGRVFDAQKLPVQSVIKQIRALQ